MTDFTAVESIFFAALEQPAGPERVAFLSQACGPDDDLRRRVDRMLAAHPQAANFMNAPPPAGTIDEPPITEPIGTMIAGRYKLLEEIGQGGMGNVWMAEQRDPVKRLVAVKLIKPGMDSRAVLARFEAERQALAMMDHPNIAKVLDGGSTAAGRPFFVMELVKGLPLTDYCDDRRLNVRGRLDLFVQVCSAIQHAHQKGVIHRDLKPSNILVTEHDGRPMPKVIDFGLAKALNASNMLTERTLHTAYGTVVGTPLYMAPEQVGINALDVDTRTDIYALGVILYELLTGTTPLQKKQFKEAAWEEIRRLIREEEPPRPSTRLSTSDALPRLAACRQIEPAKLSKMVRGELDWIVLKALEKDRNRRYETANGLALDVQRHLADEPVLACPPTAGYRLRKFVHKHRAGVLAVAGVVFVLLVGIAGTTYGLIRLEAERRRAVLAEEAAKEQMHLVTAERDRTTRALEAEKLAKESETASHLKAMKALRGPTDDLMDQVHQGKASLGPAERAQVEKDLARMQTFAAEAGTDEQARAIRARAAKQVADLRMELSQTKEALAGYQDAVAQFSALQVDFPANGGYRKELADCFIQIYALVGFVGQGDEADAARQKAMDIDAKLVEDFPTVPGYRRDLAWSYCFLGDSLERRGKKAEAEAAFRRGVATIETLAATFPADRKHGLDLAWILDRQATNFLDHGKIEEGDASHRLCLKQFESGAEELRTDVKVRQQLIGVHLRWAIALKNRRSFAEGLKSLSQAQAIVDGLISEAPGDPVRLRDLAFTQQQIGYTLAALGKNADAEAAQRRVLLIFEKLAAEYPAVTQYRRDQGTTLNTLGIVLGDLGKPDDKEAAFRKALQIREKIVAENQTDSNYRLDLAQSQRNMANIYMGRGRVTEAIAICRESIANLEKVLAELPAVAYNRQMMAWSQHRLGSALERQGALVEAEAAYQRSLFILLKLNAEFPAIPRYRQDVGQSYHSLYTTLESLGRKTEAEEACRQGLAVREKLLTEFPRDSEYGEHLIQSQAALSWLLLSSQRMEESLAWRDKEIATLKQLPPDRVDAAAVQQQLSFAIGRRADALDALGRHAEAVAAWDQAFEKASDATKTIIRMNRATTRILTGAVKDGLQEIDDVARTGGGNVQYDAACAYAQAAARRDDPAADRSARAERAMELLRQAFAMGFINAEHMKKDDDLTALRGREDYRQLVAEMEKAGVSKKEPMPAGTSK